MWQPGPPATDLALAGAQLLTNISASPFHVGKDREREEMFVTRARDNACFVAFCNAVGGQDELIFDGHSLVLDDEGGCSRARRGSRRRCSSSTSSRTMRSGAGCATCAGGRSRASAAPVPRCRSSHVGVAASQRRRGRAVRRGRRSSELEQMRLALELGLRDYVEKNGFSDVVIGVSGGIDSALTAALAVEALGAERVHCVSMPSRYSSEETRTDARRIAESLGTDFRELPIERGVGRSSGAPGRELRRPRARSHRGEHPGADRGVLLMALSNKFGWLVVATGNKSELSVGYATLYGDMAGGFALLKDVFKTDVFRLARHLNERAGRELIPASIIERAPSAELREDQRDEDSLPPYPALDGVLEAYVEQDRSREELSQDGFDPDVVERALALIDRAEYKRRQAPPASA